jgi:hypothetical protein
MQELGSLSATRTSRAQVAARPFFCGDIRRRDAGARRSRNTARVAVWRRMEQGTNHIAAFGVWRTGTRRHAALKMRAGTTRWHMPHRSDAAVALPVARREICIDPAGGASARSG